MTGEIRVTIEDQLTVQRNWNLHPSNSNSDMTGLKDAYRLGEENHLGNTGQVRMEVNTVTAPVGNAPVIYATANPAPTWPTIFFTDCEDTINALGNWYAFNKPVHLKRDCLEKSQAQTTYNRGPSFYFLTIYYFSIFIVLQKILGQNTEISSNHISHSVPKDLG